MNSSPGMPTGSGCSERGSSTYSLVFWMGRPIGRLLLPLWAVARYIETSTVASVGPTCHTRCEQLPHQ